MSLDPTPPTATALRRQPPTAAAPRSVTILGATGSIGRSTAALLGATPELFAVEALTAGSNARELARVAVALRARFAALADPAAYRELADALAGSGIEAAAGPEAVSEAAARPADWVMSAIVGFAALRPTLAALERGAIVALANKECIVCAGALLLAAAERAGAVILPVDSEHNAIFQALGADATVGRRSAGLERLLLTASGGPFRELSLAEMAGVTRARALRHPTWSMGAKITIDSATMMNKGLEIIEAHHLFAVPEPDIEVLVHPQSIVHSLVRFSDGSLLAQLGAPDMRIPIAHALGWPARLHTTSPRLDLIEAARLDFEPPDPERFPALRIARGALRAGGVQPTLVNAANEVAVEAFLEDRIGYLDIMRVVEAVTDEGGSAAGDGLSSIIACDAEARRRAAQIVQQRSGRSVAAIGASS